MRAMVLAAGLGTRLGALSSELPKPLLPVCDVPILRYGLQLLSAHGFNEVAINLHHHAELIVSELSRDNPVSVTWSREERILGTGGGLKRMADWLTDGNRAPFLAMNGKLIVDVDLQALVSKHVESGAVATMVVRETPDPERWGAIDLDESGRVVRILGSGDGRVARRTMFCGVHVLTPALLSRLPEGESCVIRQGYIPALLSNEHINSFLYTGYFQEHSTPERYLAGNFAILDGSARLSHPPALPTGIAPSAIIGSGARLNTPLLISANARIGPNAQIGPYVVIGANSEVAPGARLSNAVVWRNSRVEGEWTNAIITPRGALRASDKEHP